MSGQPSAPAGVKSPADTVGWAERHATKKQPEKNTFTLLNQVIATNSQSLEQSAILRSPGVTPLVAEVGGTYSSTCWWSLPKTPPWLLTLTRLQKSAQAHSLHNSSGHAH